MNRKIALRLIPCFSSVLLFSMNPLSAQGIEQEVAPQPVETTTLNEQLRIFFAGTPLIAFSINPPPNQELAFRARCVGNASGSATGIFADAIAIRPDSTGALGIEAVALATSSDVLSEAKAEGIDLQVAADSSQGSAIAAGFQASVAATSLDSNPLGPHPTATGIDLDVIADNPNGGAIATGIDASIRANFSPSLPPGPATSIGMRLSSQADAPLGGGSATGIQVDAGGFSGALGAGAIGIVASAVADGEDSNAWGGQFDANASAAAFGGACGVLATASYVGPNGSSFGVRGVAGSDPGTGVEGTGPTFGVFSSGNLGASGVKSFVQPHPNSPEHVVHFISLEGNESGTYFRGTSRLVDGVAELDIPHEWRLVTEQDGITVQVTAIGCPSQLYVAEQSHRRIVIRGEYDCEFNYFVNGLRRGFADYQPYHENRAFRPEVRGVPFGTQYPEAVRQILVQNGILNPDYTPNEMTAAALGWQLKDTEEVRIQERWWLDPGERQRLLEDQRHQQH